MADDRRGGFGVAELVLIAVSLCVMVALGIVAASAFSADPSTSEDELATPSPTPLSIRPVKPAGEPVVPPAAGSGVWGTWVSDVDARTGIGEVALQAYGSATLRLGREQPACRLGWTTLAGIGGIESQHGTSGGAQLLADGRTSQPILGPALDGTNGNAAIRATGLTTALHGDPRWDHAVGPLQFIPSTWERWQSDGNDDGTLDPGNVYDAAYAAGRYLCAAGTDLSTGAGWTRAIFAYNHSDDYVRSVLAFANAYARAR